MTKLLQARRVLTEPAGFSPLVKSVYQKLFVFFLNQNICCGYSKEPSQ